MSETLHAHLNEQESIVWQKRKEGLWQGTRVSGRVDVVGVVPGGGIS